MRPRYRVWLEDDGPACGPVFGDGLAALLRGVAAMGSLRAAAAAMGMSYRAAWGRVRRGEARLGWRLLESRTGGKSGGGAAISLAGRRFLDCYDDFRRRLDAAVDDAFNASGLAGFDRSG